MKSFINRFRNISLVFVLLIWQVVFGAAPLIQSSLAHAVPAPQCVNDTAGANDVPGQKDLTKLCVDYSGAPTTVSTNWNWDELGTSGNNTMDACNLFDTNGNGNVDYAVCATTQGNPASLQGFTTYQCSDKSVDTCSAPNSVVSSGTTNCTVQQSSDDPFPADSNYPNDTQGACTVDLSTVGGSSASLIDVCSYPSSSPTSDPSDCVIAVPGKAKLEVVKDLAPNSDPGLFDLKIDGTKYASAVGDGGNTGEQIVTADNNNNSHIVLEAASSTSPTTLSQYNTSVVCKDAHGTGNTLATGNPTGSSSRQLSVTVAKDSDVVCTFTNTRQNGNITVTKVVNNNHGGTKQVSDFPLFVNSTQVTSGASNSFTAGQSYTISETQQTGYQQDSLVCKDSATNATLANPFTLAPSENVSCTVTNSDIAPTLTLVKTVTNDNGGTKQASDFQGKIDANNVSWSVAVPLSAGSHTASEVNLPGYQAGSWGGDCAANGTITLVLGQNATCTITNDDIAPSLTLNKIVSNTHGGTALESAWTLHADGSSQSPTNLSGPGAAGNTDVVSGNNFKADTYTLSETGGPNGYSASAWSCTNGVSVNGQSQITIANGQSTVCTITNSDVAPTLTITKMVINPYGTAAPVSSFPLFVDSTQVTSGVANTQFNAGSHSVSETQQTGYSLSSVSGDCSQDKQGNIGLTLSIGGSYTCTLTNTAIQPEVKVIKHVINDNSGTQTANDFTMTVTGNSQSVTPFAGDENGTTVGLNEGNYTVGETSHTGYAETFSGDCNSTIAIGETKTCTITNNDIPNPGIHIVKSGPAVAHEGDKVTYSFTVTNTGDIALSNVTVNDNIVGGADYVSGDTNNNGLLDKTETWVFTKDYTIPTPQIADVTNTAIACGDYSDGTTSGTDVCNSDKHTLDVIHPSISVQKYGPATAYQGDNVTYYFYVTNTGDTELHNVGVADDLAVGEICDETVLAPGDSTWCSATYTIPSDQTADVTNHVTASGTDQLDETVTGIDQHTLTVLVPGIHVVKSGPATAQPGQTVTYTFTVTNTGNTPLDSITVNDNIAGAGTYQSGDTNHDNILEAGEAWVYTATYKIPDNQNVSVTNTVTACGSPFSQQEVDEEISQISLDITSHKVCSQDKHTTNIPLVLGSSTVTATPTLVNTGQNALLSIFAGLAVIGLAGAVAWAPKKK